MYDNQNNVDVFEMILKSTGGTPAAVLAVPSQKTIDEDWQEDHQEGQLAVDVINTEKKLIVISTIAGVDTEKFEVYIHNDLLTIRGTRVVPVEEGNTNSDHEPTQIGEENIEFLYQECFWGKFSRTIVLPVDVKGDKAKAEYKNGILVVKIPKRKTGSKIDIKIVDE